MAIDQITTHVDAASFEAAMAPVKPKRDIKVTVPRQNAQRIGTKLSAELKRQGNSKGILLQTAQPSSRLAQAIVCGLSALAPSLMGFVS